jgi:hypothetical protein
MLVDVKPYLTVDGPPGRIKWTEGMLNSIDVDVDITKIVGDKWKFVFGPVAKVPGQDYYAFGYTYANKRKLEIRHGMGQLARDLTKGETQYTELHEWGGHGGDATVMTNDKRELILKEMGLGAAIDARQATGVSRGKAIIYVWSRGDLTIPARQVPYWKRPYEAYCDMLVSAISSLPSVFAKRYTWDISAEKLKEIMLLAPPAIPLPPEPLPEPPDPIPPEPEPTYVDVKTGETVIIRGTE